MKTVAVIDHIVHWLAAYAEQSTAQGFVVGISGGIDSAVTSTLAARTRLPVLCLEMPIHQPESHVSRARKHIDWLKSEHRNLSSKRTDLTSVFDSLVHLLPDSPDRQRGQLAQANTRARLRMTTLYHMAGLHGYLVAGTGNKVEDFGVGFFTKYGDGGVDISPIADLNKSEVYELGESLGIMQEIMQARPTDGLWGDDRSDEDQLGASYEELEWAMDQDCDNPVLNNAREEKVFRIFRALHQANRHKMKPIPVCTIPPELRQGSG